MVTDVKGLLYYKLGEFVGKIMVQGIIHPDMTKSNLPFDLKTFRYRFVDFAEIRKILIPEELDDNNIRCMTEALFPIIDRTDGSFYLCSSFRAGFIARAGILGWKIFANASLNGYTSSVYTKRKWKGFEPSKMKMSSELVDSINRWKNIENDAITIKQFSSLQEYYDSEIRKSLPDKDKYYLDMLYLLRCVSVFLNEDNAEPMLASAEMNMAFVAANYNMPYTEYGLLKKCLKSRLGVKEIDEICKQRSIQILVSGNLDPEGIGFVDECADKYDLFELLWILNDEDSFANGRKGAADS